MVCLADMEALSYVSDIKWVKTILQLLYKSWSFKMSVLWLGTFKELRKHHEAFKTITANCTFYLITDTILYVRASTFSLIDVKLMHWNNVNLCSITFLAAGVSPGFHNLKIKIRRLLSIKLIRILQVIVAFIDNLPGTMYFTSNTS